MPEIGERVEGNCTFEATPFWRSVLDSEFPVRELEVDLGESALFLWRHRLRRTWISTPFRDQMALVWGSGPLPDFIDIERVIRSVGRAPVVLKDFAGLFPAASPPSRDFHFRQQYTNCDVALDSELTSRLKPAARKNLRKAREEHGLEFLVNPGGSLEVFLRLYHLTRRRLGVAPYSRSFFRGLFGGMGEGGPVVLFEARRGKERLGFLVCYCHGREIISAHLAYDFDRRAMRITDFLFMSAFLWGRERGFTNYRFGADFNNQRGLIRSKEKLGAVPRLQNDLARGSVTARRDRPYSLARRILRKTPIPIFRYVGLLSRLYFE